MAKFITVLFVIFVFACAFFALGYIPSQASMLYGPPAGQLSISDRIEYSARLLWYGSELSSPFDPGGIEQVFRIEQGESVASVTERLQQAGLIRSSAQLFDYLVYMGYDITLQAGEFRLSPAQSVIDIARELQDSTPQDVTFTILAGWRMEEIAASLPTSGLSVTSDEFLAASQTPPHVLAFAAPIHMEGYFYPDSYILPRATTVGQLIEIIARNFAHHITQDLVNGFSAQGLTVNQAVILASIVERESIQDEEMPLIASVFINRLNIGMTLGSDPTVQYALGYDPAALTWWTNPLSLDDLKIDSPYNTYLYAGLPPRPISNPGISAMRAVAQPEISPYYYFQARCDGSGYHTFAVSFEEHLANGCQ